MGRLEMADTKSRAFTLFLTLYEAVLALYAMYYLCVSIINYFIPESLIPGF
jgi:hypothetical protein